MYLPQPQPSRVRIAASTTSFFSMAEAMALHRTCPVEDVPQLAAGQPEARHRHECLDTREAFVGQRPDLVEHALLRGEDVPDDRCDAIAGACSRRNCLCFRVA